MDYVTVESNVVSSEPITGSEAVKAQAEGLFQKVFNPISNMMSEMGKGFSQFTSDMKENIGKVVNPDAGDMVVNVEATEVAAEASALAIPSNAAQQVTEEIGNNAGQAGNVLTQGFDTVKEKAGEFFGKAGEVFNQNKDKLIEWGNNNPELRNVAIAATAVAAVGGTAMVVHNKSKQQPAAVEGKWANRIRAEQAAMAQQQGAAMAY